VGSWKKHIFRNKEFKVLVVPRILLFVGKDASIALCSHDEKATIMGYSVRRGEAD
jgi:hypothetical protein